MKTIIDCEEEAWESISKYKILEYKLALCEAKYSAHFMFNHVCESYSLLDIKKYLESKGYDVYRLNYFKKGLDVLNKVLEKKKQLMDKYNLTK